MGDCWIITDEFKRTNLENRLYHKKWENNTPRGTKVAILLELLEVLECKGRHILSRLVMIRFDNY